MNVPELSDVYMDKLLDPGSYRLGSLPLETRYMLIEGLVELIEERAPPPKDNPHQDVDEDALSREVGALCAVVSSISLPGSYQTFLKRTHNVAQKLLGEDLDLLEDIAGWKHLGFYKQIGVFRRIHQLYNDAASYASGIKFPETDFVFKRKLPSNNVIGSCAWHIEEGRTLTQIFVKDIESGFKAVEYSIHESAHHHQAIFGTLAAQQPALLNAGLRHVGRMSEASIFAPSRIDTPYRGQWHEIAAYSEGEIMETAARKYIKALGIAEPDREPSLQVV